MAVTREEYLKIYAEGYVAGIEKAKGDAECPYIDAKGIMERYGKRIGIGKAREILRAVRMHCNGGMLESSSIVKMSELLYWESCVDKTYLARL